MESLGSFHPPITQAGNNPLLKLGCGIPMENNIWVSCSLNILANMNIPLKDCEGVTSCFQKIAKLKDDPYFHHISLSTNATKNESSDSSSQEFLCHETLSESTYYVKGAQFWLEGVCILIIGSFGLVGNVMTLLVLRRLDSNTTYNKLLMTLAIIDFLLILYYVLDFGLVGTFLRSQNKAEPLWYRMSYPYFLHPFRWIVVSASIFMIVAISAERYRAICYPLTHRPAFWPYFLLVLLTSGVQNIPKLFEFQLDTSMNETDYITTPLNDDQRYITFSSWWDELIVTGIIPFSALVIFNTCIYLKLKASDRLEYRFIGKKATPRVEVDRSSSVHLISPAIRHGTTTTYDGCRSSSTSKAVFMNQSNVLDSIATLSMEEGKEQNTLPRTRNPNSNQSSTHFRKRREKSAMILMSIVLTFLFCHTFRLVIQAYEVTHPSHSTPDHHAFCYKRGRIHVPVAFYVMLSASNLLLVVNSSMNFIIYCCVGKTFREELKAIFSAICIEKCLAKN